MIEISVIICTYNRADLLRETISSLKQHVKNVSKIEVLIIDNNSTDHTKDVFNSFSDFCELKYFLEPVQGLSAARNRGIAEARFDLLVFLDDDIELKSNYFSVLKELFDNPSVTIAGGKVLPFEVSIPSWLPNKYFYLASIFDKGDERIIVNDVMGANYAMRKKVANEVGLYNTNLGRKGNSLMGGEENDYFNRARYHGFNVTYEPRLVVYHKIQNKLNHKYIIDYSYLNGKSEKYIDRKSKKAKYFFKSVKCAIMIFAYYMIPSLLLDGKKRAFLNIEKDYGRGYLGY